MGDLVLTEDEVNPVMSALLENGFDVTALHNHFFWEQPRIFYMHVHGMGTPADLSNASEAGHRADRQGHGRSACADRHRPCRPGRLNGAAVAAIVGHQGEQTGPVYKITIGRPDMPSGSTAPRSTHAWA